MIINKKRFKKILTNDYKYKQMHVNRGLIGVHVSSIVKWGYWDNFKPVVFFFLQKDFARTKSTKTLNKRLSPS